MSSHGHYVQLPTEPSADRLDRDKEKISHGSEIKSKKHGALFFQVLSLFAILWQVSCQRYFLCSCVYRQTRRSAIKHSQSGDVSQATQRLKGRKKLQRGLSEDVPYCTRPQVCNNTAPKRPRYHQPRHHSSPCASRNQLNWSRWITCRTLMNIWAWTVTAERHLCHDSMLSTT